jgi:hypothetical protein
MTATQELIFVRIARAFQSKRYFDVCEINNVHKIAGIDWNAPDYVFLRSAHCVSWDQMSFDLKRELAQRTLALFGLPLEHAPRLLPSLSLPTGD